MHGDFRKVENSSDTTAKNPKSENANETPTTDVPFINVSTRVTHFTESNGGLKSSMIVPVWVSHENRPETEKLVYAILDTQSDVSFILDSTQDALGVQGIPTKLHLSTMSANNQLIECARLDGLRVRGHDSTEYISLPPVFSRSIIPVNRDHIPTSETANRWPHLQRIAHSLMPINECEVGLLLGYNCSKDSHHRKLFYLILRVPMHKKQHWGGV